MFKNFLLNYHTSKKFRFAPGAFGFVHFFLDKKTNRSGGRQKNQEISKLLHTKAYARPLSFQANALVYKDLQKFKHALNGR